jgi:hypothetical protein
MWRMDFWNAELQTPMILRDVVLESLGNGSQFVGNVQPVGEVLPNMCLLFAMGLSF